MIISPQAILVVVQATHGSRALDLFFFFNFSNELVKQMFYVFVCLFFVHKLYVAMGRAELIQNTMGPMKKASGDCFGFNRKQSSPSEVVLAVR